MSTHTLTKEMKISEVHAAIRRAQSGDTLLVPPDEVDLVKRALRNVAPSKALTVKAVAAASEVTNGNR